MTSRSIYMVASENGALPGAKAGGVGDVLRDLPRALAARGHELTVVIPSYGHLHTLPGMQLQGSFETLFSGELIAVRWFAMMDEQGVRHIVLDHPGFDPFGSGQVYCDDGPDRPFATDANKYALLCAAAGQWLLRHAPPDALIHLHDWHAAPLLVLREYDERYARLKAHRCVLTLHNLALQGIRPIEGDASSFMSWFAHLRHALPALGDPRYPDVVNPIAAGIRLADALNTVSPTNAREILIANDPARGFRGGEGLELLLQQADDSARLYGILNGCDYDGDFSTLDWRALRRIAVATLSDWLTQQPQYQGVHQLALDALNRFDSNPDIVVTSVGRITDQKVGLLLHRNEQGQTTLDQLLHTLPDRGVLLMLGSGDRQMEQQLVEHARRDPRFVFLRGFSEKLADSIFRGGNLFLMPSTFEPCGISQMLAMRAGQPCLVHSVGGLNDTITHLRNGFAFTGCSTTQQSLRCISALQLAQRMYFDEPTYWARITRAAAAERFEWQHSAAHYERQLYAFD
ncbi:MAG: glycogen/starch synthase [Pseudomonadota bacterium]